MKTKLILLEDLKDIGKRGEVKYVKSGYARNHLIPKGKARLATQDALDEIDEQLRQQEMLASQELVKVQRTAEEIDGITVFIQAKADENGTIYGGISAPHIQQALNDIGVEVSEASIQLAEPFKQLGEYKVQLNLDHGIEAYFNLVIESESQLSQSQDMLIKKITPIKEQPAQTSKTTPNKQQTKVATKKRFKLK